MSMADPVILPAPRGPQSSPLRIAHRGASAEAPENTLASVRAAVAQGCDFVEVDVQRTKDGALVLFHDRTTLDRTTNIQRVFPGRRRATVAQLTLAELRSLEVGSWFAPQYAGEPVATLAEVLAVLDGTGCGLLVEVKSAAPAYHLADDLLALLRGMPLVTAGLVAQRRLLVQSFDHAEMARLKALEPSLPVGLLGKPPRATLPDLGRWADMVNPHHAAVEASYLSAVRDAGMASLLWTVNSRTSMSRALRLAPDGIITDRPRLLKRMFASADA